MAVYGPKSNEILGMYNNNLGARQSFWIKEEFLSTVNNFPVATTISLQPSMLLMQDKEPSGGSMTHELEVCSGREELVKISLSTILFHRSLPHRVVAKKKRTLQALPQTLQKM